MPLSKSEMPTLMTNDLFGSGFSNRSFGVGGRYVVGIFKTRREPIHGGSGRASMRATVLKMPTTHRPPPTIELYASAAKDPEASRTHLLPSFIELSNSDSKAEEATIELPIFATAIELAQPARCFRISNLRAQRVGSSAHSGGGARDAATGRTDWHSSICGVAQADRAVGGGLRDRGAQGFAPRAPRDGFTACLANPHPLIEPRSRRTQ